MNTESLTLLLGWSALLNYGLIALWFIAFVFMKNSIYTLHQRFFDITKEQFEAINYALLGFYKLCTLLLFVMPYIALRFFL